MGVWPFVAAAVVLSIERIAYVWIWHRPAAFANLVDDPVAGVQRLFAAFKALQAGVFVWWCWLHGEGSLVPAAPVAAAGIGLLLLAFGQILNAGVFRQLGTVGVFYGNRFGQQLPWCRAFPFTWFRHPQYVGAVLSIWGFFVLMRFPHADWYLIPVLETIYYAIGATLED